MNQRGGLKNLSKSKPPNNKDVSWALFDKFQATLKQNPHKRNSTSNQKEFEVLRKGGVSSLHIIFSHELVFIFQSLFINLLIDPLDFPLEGFLSQHVRNKVGTLSRSFSISGTKQIATHTHVLFFTGARDCKHTFRTCP